MPALQNTCHQPNRSVPDITPNSTQSLPHSPVVAGQRHVVLVDVGDRGGDDVNLEGIVGAALITPCTTGEQSLS